MSLIGRIFVIIFAVMVASLAAGMAIATGVLGPAWHSMSGDPAERFIFWGATFVGATVTGAAGLLPLFILIVLGETFKIRSLLANVAAGAVMVLLAYYGSGLAPSRYEESIDQPPPAIAINREMEIAAAAGAVFGLVYWAIAGRKAGRWREKQVA
jgi:hypothetical protein